MTAVTAIVGLSAYGFHVLAVLLLARLSVRCFRLWWRMQRKNAAAIAAT